jgi:hypothetical protein
MCPCICQCCICIRSHLQRSYAGCCISDGADSNRQQLNVTTSCTLHPTRTSETAPSLQVEQRKAPSALTYACVLEALAKHLDATDRAASRALHLTCRAGALAVQGATRALELRGKHVDLGLLTASFPGLRCLTLKQCALTLVRRCPGVIVKT